MSPMRWWMATFDTPDGERAQLVNVVQAECEGLSTLQRVYVKARTKSEAIARARYVRGRMVHDARCAENRAKGLCGCGKPLDRGVNPNTGTPYVKCTKCQGVITPYVTNPSAKAPPVDERKDEQPRAGDSVKTVELKLLKLVQFEFQTTGTIGLFKEWIRQQIQMREQ